MSAHEPDFYLTSSEGYDLSDPRSCWRLKRISTEHRNDLLLAKIEPPLVGQKFGLANQDVYIVLLAPRHQGGSLFPVNEWPLYVHVARPLIKRPEDRDFISDRDFELIAWGEIYRTLKEVSG